MIGRKLQNTLQGLELLTKQESVEGFLKNTKNADKLRDLVGEIGDAVMDYQVCIRVNQSCSCLTPIPDFIATGHL